MKKQSRYEYKLTSDQMEKPNKQKSMTMPDDALTLETLLTRYTQGIPLEPKAGQFPDGDQETDIDDIDLEEYNKMDITEQKEVVGEMRAKVEKAQRRAEREQKKKEAEQAQKTEPKTDEKK
jgi:hypothetical protein